MRIVDADSHFMEPLGWFQDSFPELASRCPAVPLVDMVLEALMWRPRDLPAARALARRA